MVGYQKGITIIAGHLEGGLLLRGGRGKREVRGRGGNGKERGGESKERETEGKDQPPPPNILA